MKNLIVSIKNAIFPPPPLIMKDFEVHAMVLEFKSAFECIKENKEMLERLKELLKSTGAFVDCRRFDDYERLNFISGGSQGAVYKARHKATGQIVAMKAVFKGMTVFTFREIDILKSLRGHPNVVGFKEVAADDSNGVFIVMEYAEHDVRRYMEAAAGKFTTAMVKSLMMQLLKGVNFLHQNMIMHRDLKPTNLLVNGDGVLKICDFGISRRMDVAPVFYSTSVGTRYYKAPELSIGKYSHAVDMWAVGCIMAEMLLRSDGNTQARKLLPTIYAILEKAKGGFEGFCFLRRHLFPAKVVSDFGFNLLIKLLSWDANERITAKSALNHAWFKEL